MSVLDDIAAKQPETRSCEFPLDSALATRLGEAQARLEQAKRAVAALKADSATEAKDAALSERDDAQEQVTALAEELRPNMLRFEFAPVDPETFEALKTEHRPTEKQRTEARKEKQPQPEWNVEAFAPALIAAACVRVEGPSGTHDGLSVEEALAICQSERFNVAERNELFNTALSAYVSRTRVSLPKSSTGSGVTRT